MSTPSRLHNHRTRAAFQAHAVASERMARIWVATAVALRTTRTWLRASSSGQAFRADGSKTRLSAQGHDGSDQWCVTRSCTERRTHSSAPGTSAQAGADHPQLFFRLGGPGGCRKQGTLLDPKWPMVPQGERFMNNLPMLGRPPRKVNNFTSTIFRAISASKYSRAARARNCV